jgi:hypothetical protein
VVWYCGPECQKKYYKGHKTLCLRFSSADIRQDELLPYRDPMKFRHCVACRRRIRTCSCARVVSSAKGIVYFALPPAPPDYTIAKRITRWAYFVNYHPLLSAYDAPLDVSRRLNKLARGAEVARPVAVDLVERYKANGTEGVAETLGVPPELRRAFGQTSNECADAAVANLLAGNWGCISVSEYLLLYYAFERCQPVGYDPDAYAGFQALADMVGTIVGAFKLSGIDCGAFRLEETEEEVEVCID